MPWVRRTWARNIVPNLPAPTSPTVTGRPAASRASSLACRFMGALPAVAANRSTPDAARRELRGSRSMGEERSLLAERARHVALDHARRRRLAVRPVERDRRTFLRRLEIDAAAGREAVRLADRFRSGTAVGRAIRRRRTDHALGDHARAGNARHRAGGVAGHGTGRVGGI